MDTMNADTPTQLPPWLQALSDHCDARYRISEKQRELPYNKWVEYDNKIAEIEARKAFDQAYRTWEAERCPMPRPAQPRQRKAPAKNNWYTDQHGNLIVRTQLRRKPNERPI